MGFIWTYRKSEKLEFQDLQKLWLFNEKRKKDWVNKEGWLNSFFGATEWIREMLKWHWNPDSLWLPQDKSWEEKNEEEE